MEKEINLLNDLINDICAEFHLVSNALNHCCQMIANSNEFEYPIIVVTKDDTDLGITAISESHLGNKLLYRASYLEILVMNNIIRTGEINDFKTIYDSQINHCCFLVMQDDNIKILYLPYK